ncbi:MAG: hypothetical protein Q9201_000531 [Fulgogasparrea decipioides]
MLNTDRTFSGEGLELTSFPLLPKELRLKIWLYALQHQRMIHLRLEYCPKADAAELAQRSPESYTVTVDGCHVFSNVLKVNHESREEALIFYRVCLPCRYKRGKTTTYPGTLSLNPEYDFLHISSGWPVTHTLLAFLYHLRTTYDPRHQGLLNLAVDINSLTGNDLMTLQPINIHPRDRRAFVETLRQLREVFFISTPRVGRQNFGYQSGTETPETMFNRSLPIVTATPTFERLHRDPRPIAQDLRKVFVGTSDPREMLLFWERLLKIWQVSPTRIEYRFLLAFDPTLGGDAISTRTGAEKWLQREDDVWRNPSANGIAMMNERLPVGASSEMVQDEDLERAVRPAFGFWLFRVEALGALHEEGHPEDQGFLPKGKQMLDMTKYWPELALLKLN